MHSKRALEQRLIVKSAQCMGRHRRSRHTSDLITWSEAATASHCLSSTLSNTIQFNSLWGTKDLSMSEEQRNGYLAYLQQTFGSESLKSWEEHLRTDIFGGYAILEYLYESCFQVIHFCSRLLTF